MREGREKGSLTRTRNIKRSNTVTSDTRNVRSSTRGACVIMRVFSSHPLRNTQRMRHPESQRLNSRRGATLQIQGRNYIMNHDPISRPKGP